MSLKKLKFRRQFILSPESSSKLEGWFHEQLGQHELYVHPDCFTTIVKHNEKKGVLLGHVLDPRNAKLTSTDILEKLVTQNDEEGIAEVLYGLTGRFVLIIEEENEFTFFNDACGLKTFFYKTIKDKLCFASQPLLINHVFPGTIVKGERFNSFHNSEYLKKSKESWYPSGTSLYDGVNQLAPNHYLKTNELKQTRYWPNKIHKIEDFESAFEKFSTLLKQTLEVGSEKYNLALGLTGGFDSRIILSACKTVKAKMIFYTLKYRTLDKNNSDIWIPLKLKDTLGIDHKVMNCKMSTDDEFKDIYLSNSDMAHLDDWGYIAYGISKNLPEGTMAIKGSCSETGRCYFYKNGKHPKINSSKDILAYNPNWKGISFIENRIEEWYDNIKRPENNKGYNILDLFHWEVSTGSWQTQNQLEWDMVHDTFTPFNNRELLDTMLRIVPKYRSQPKNYLLYQKTMAKLWPEVLTEPINPKSFKEQIKVTVKSFLVKLGYEKYNH
ncbi:asparagine synthetase B family protein [Hyunsoonleella pacifica]|uniref:asparagine synthase (glutamine-hydrolyzing) n=1 Tax=Hyunsoonleella pacifica TaxID=1080224 RepID=A0A4Q9FSJ0_9FLAO|nr:hypothetical protein [Hyunsoonleella pacifica]TBN18650.1 hypothetical protein EYD46_00870 [Hyunsoonleella pacifica]GGD03549.1 hypothetical protein GCM10011368_01730 [Hyunsoonleella pacifica]